MKTLVLKIEYDGTEYGGWQIQKNARTVQEEIENALEKISHHRLSVTGAGRTDAGVHARGQVAHALLESKFPVPEKKIPPVLNSKLPKDIRIKAASILASDFHSRYDAIAREYSYTISSEESVFDNRFSTYLKYRLDFQTLQDSCKIFVGKHEFTTFSKRNPDTKNYVCNVKICKWQPVGSHSWKMIIKADRFVYGMVRSITGAMLDAARGKRTLKDIESALNKCDRSLSSPLAPAKGLVLEKIYYAKKFQLFEI
jgi:tRNA pseudouridine38-40 synthase